MPIETVNLPCESLSEGKEGKFVPFQVPGAVDALRFWKLYAGGVGGLLWNCELMYFYIPVYFTEKLLPSLVPPVPMFYATPAPPASLHPEKWKGCRSIQIQKRGLPRPPHWLIVLLTLVPRRGVHDRQAGGALRAWLLTWRRSSS